MAVTITQTHFQAGIDSVQPQIEKWYYTPAPISGNIIITVGEETTANIAYNANAATIETAILIISEEWDVTGAGTQANPFIATRTQNWDNETFTVASGTPGLSDVSVGPLIDGWLVQA